MASLGPMAGMASEEPDILNFLGVLLMPQDPICGKEITDTRDAPKTEYHGKLYYFESDDCKRAFEDNPRRYARAESKQQ